MLLRRVVSIGLLMFAFLFGKVQSYNWLWSCTPTGKLQLYRNYIYTSNTFSGTSITIGDSVYQSRGGTDVFLVKRDSKGNNLWARTIGGPNNESLESMTVDGQGN